jgi:dipeptidyl aminopeptidase/acylaminoacyl peptidase
MTDDATASQRQDITPEELARLPEFYAPAVSPDGDALAFFHDTSGRMELYTLDLSDGSWTRWSDGNVPRNLSGGLAWAADGERIYFHRDEGGNEQTDIHAITPDGETEPIIETDGQAKLAAVDPNGRILLYCSDEAGQFNVHRYDCETGETSQFTDHTRPVWPQGVSVSPDGTAVSYGTNESDDPENHDIYVRELGSDDSRRLDVGETGAEAGADDWFPDGERLLVRDNTENRSRAGVYDLRDGGVTWLSEGGGEEQPVCPSPDGELVVVLRTREAATVPVVYDVASGDNRELAVPEGTASGVGGLDGGFVDDRQFLLTNETGTQRKAVLQYDLSTDEYETVIEPEYDDVDTSWFVEPEYVTYESDDGLEIGALLYETRENPGPAVVKVHGGPTAQSKQWFDIFAQFLVSQGYTVLCPNYRGSTGRGREFKYEIRNDWGGMEQVDIRCGAEYLAKRESVDPDNIAVFGASYGGYSAYCQLTMHPEPWAAGIAYIGMTDLLALYEESMPHFKSMLEDMLGDPDENEAFYRERSPIEHVGNVDAPFYIIHGVNDPRCPISQARTFRDALEDQGLTQGEDGEFEYTELGEEGHGSTDVEQKVRAFELLGDFLDRRL